MGFNKLQPRRYWTPAKFQFRGQFVRRHILERFQHGGLVSCATGDLIVAMFTRLQRKTQWVHGCPKLQVTHRFKLCAYVVFVSEFFHLFQDTKTRHVKANPTQFEGAA